MTLRIIRTILATVLIVLVLVQMDRTKIFPPFFTLNKRLKPPKPDKTAVLFNQLRQDGDILATTVAGKIPFYYQGNVLDIYGLCDEYIAHNGRPRLFKKSVGGRLHHEYVLSKQPAFYYFNNTSFIKGFFNHRREVLRDYTVITFKNKREEMIMIRNDRLNQDAINEWLKLLKK